MTFHEVTIGPCRLILGDCRDVLPVLPKVDAVVTDPPYGIKMARRALGSVNMAPVRQYEKSDWDDVPCSPEQIALMTAVSDWQIIFGGNYFELPPTSCWLVWDKRTTGNYAECELAWTNLHKAVRKIEWLWNGMIRKGDDIRIHPTQKPLGVMRWCLTHLPDCRSLIDPFMGSGTTVCAAIDAADYETVIGVENDPGMFDKACARIAQHWALKCSELPFDKPAPMVQRSLLGDTP